MSSSIPQLKLFPLYPGGPVVQNRGTLNANSSFYTRATRYTPSYPVNIPSSSTPTNTFFNIDGKRIVATQPASADQLFNTPLNIDGTASGKLRTATVPSQAPTIPSLYQNAVDLLSISDLKFSDLVNQPDFRIPGIGMGLKVTTDGMGGIDKVELSPGSRGNLPGVSAIAKDFVLPNRTDITTGATFFRSGLPFNVKGATAANAIKPLQKLNPAALQANLLSQLNPNTLNRNAGIFKQDQLEKLALSALEDKNFDFDKVNLEKLFQLQSQDNGIAVAGYDSALDAEQSRQLAASQSGLDVNTSPEFRQNMAELVSAARQPSENYASVFGPRLDQVMNGRINVTPWQQAAANAGQSGMGANSGSAFEMGGAVADAASRKGRSAMYMPFQMDSGSQGQGFANANPFTGGRLQSGMSFGGQTGAEQQFQRRRPMAFMA